MNALKVIFQDVDGCLNAVDGEHFGVGPDTELTKAQIEILAEINAAVDASSLDHFVINTGRYWPILEPIVRYLPTDKLRYFICEHACVIYDRVEGENLDLVGLAQRYGYDDLATRYQNLDTMRELLAWYDEVGCPAMESTYQQVMDRLDKVGNLSFAIPEKADGGDVLDKIEQLIRQDFSAEFIGRFEFCRSDSFIDILPGIHKLDGLRLMLAHLGLADEEAIAVGDYLNDQAIFETFDRVMCPSNAHESIKALTLAKGSGSYVSEQAYGAATLELLRSLARSNYTASN